MQCEICGKNDETMYKTNIEGSTMNVCINCRSLGKVMHEVRPETRRDLKNQKRVAETKVVVEKVILEKIRDDYANIIHKEREKRKMTQEEFSKMLNEKESLIHHIESGKNPPSLTLAKKLEKALRISLIETYEEKHKTIKTNTGELTLGDFIKIKEARKKQE